MSENQTIDTPQGKPPKNYLIESILVTILCCLPFGIAGIVNATKVDTLYSSGDVMGAEQAAANAKKWTTIGFVLGLVVAVIYAILMAVGVAGSAMG